jgi:hypothetical protein
MSIGPLIGIQIIMNDTGEITGYRITFLEWAVTPNGWDFDERHEYYSGKTAENCTKVYNRIMELETNKRKYTDIEIFPLYSDINIFNE